VLDRAAAAGGVVPGDEAFRLYDSLGVPLDFMEDLAGQRNLTIDREGYERAMEGSARRRAPAARSRGRKGIAFTMPPDVERALDEAGDQFAGYDSTCERGVPVLALFDESGASVDELRAGARGYVALAKTPFYLEAGGQVSDTGRIYGGDGAEATVERMVKQAPAAAAARRPVDAGTLRRGQIVTAEVADAVRDATRRNHTATHLLHAALRQVLGPHVKQAGSLVAPDRLRFDFVHFAALTQEQIDAIERIVNEQIVRNTPVQTEVRSTEEAMAAGAMALFGEKYGDRVRVVSVPGFSMELCGGTHVRATGDIGPFVITEEAAWRPASGASRR
jgi:alanyl-tRNA synthetase